MLKIEQGSTKDIHGGRKAYNLGLILESTGIINVLPILNSLF